MFYLHCRIPLGSGPKLTPSPGIALGQRESASPRSISSLEESPIQWLVDESMKAQTPCHNLRQLWKATQLKSFQESGWDIFSFATMLQFIISLCPILLLSLLSKFLGAYANKLPASKSSSQTLFPWEPSLCPSTNQNLGIQQIIQ